MTESSLERPRRWWRHLAECDTTVLVPFAHELCGLDDKARALGLVPHIDLPCAPPPHSEVPTGEPSFSGLAMSTLIGLRGALQLRRSESDAIFAWAETLLRFSEVHRTSLVARAKAKWGGPPGAYFGLLQLGAFFLDYYDWSEDLRYLNTALKLQDLRFVLRRTDVPAGLQQSGRRLHEALLALRISVITESAIDRLESVA